MTGRPIPDAALDDRLGFIGTAGSGKTYNAGGAVERLLLRRRSRVVIVDPLGVWWGLRLLADGKTSSPYNVAIFGGAHGDLPLNEYAGAVIGETAATMIESCIIDLNELGAKAPERRFMTAFLETIFRRATGEPFHLIVDEADLFAPQKPQKGDETLLGLMEQIVRRGRVKGFIPWLISQRPAVLNKNVLSQVDGLVSFKLTASQDRDALDAWIEGQADRVEGRAIKDSLPALQIGQGVVWIPGRSVLTTAAFPQKITYDSSRTPRRGEKVKLTIALNPLDLTALREKLSTVETETKANDPKRLRARIAELEREAKTKPPAAPLATGSRREDIATISALRKALEAAVKFIVEINAADFFKSGGEAIDQAALEKVIADATRQATRLIEKHLERRDKELDAVRRESGRLIGRIKALLDQDVTVKVDVRHNDSFTISPTPALPVRPSPAPRERVIAAGDGTLPKGERACLAAMAQHHDGVTRQQLTILTGYKRSTRDAYIQRLRDRGLAVQSDGRLFSTPEGDEALGPDFARLPTGDALREHWLTTLPDGERRVLGAVIEHYPDAATRDEIDFATNFKRSTRDAYIQRLRARELVVVDGYGVRAAETLFEGPT